MGLTIHYQGQLKKMSDLPKLTSEVADICDTMNWSCQDFNIKESKDDEVNKVLGLLPGEVLHLDGIIFKPHPRCESVTLVFDQKGRLCSPMIPLMAQASDDPEYIWCGFTKTQFAGPDTHIALVRLLKYLEKRYFQKLEISDEGDYWESGDETKLRSLFIQLEIAINVLTAAFEKEIIQKGVSTEDIVKKIETLLKKLWEDKNKTEE
jgi:hypothetical protein